MEDWLKTDAETWRWWWRAGSRETLDVSPVAPGAVILAGVKDESLGPYVQHKLTAAHLRAATVQSVPDSNHLLALDAPEVVARVIAQAAQTPG